MNPYLIENLFGIEGFHIAWYGVIISFGMILAVILAISRARKLGLKDDLIIDFVLWAIPISIVCARLYYVIFEWESYSGNLIKIFALREGGLAIYGGILGGIAVAYFFTKYHKFPFLTFLDLATPCLILGQIIGRWGNFTNQEAYGRLVTNEKLQFFPYSVYIDRLQEWHHATFFYESIWNLCLIIFILILEKKIRKTGITFSLYLIGYGLGRFFIEGLRDDSLYLLPGIRVSQVLSAVLFIGGIIFIIYCLKYRNKTDEYTGKYLKDKSQDSQN